MARCYVEQTDDLALLVSRYMYAKLQSTEQDLGIGERLTEHGMQRALVAPGPGHCPAAPAH